MNLAKQLPFVFPNKVAVCSFNARCESCKGVLTADRIEADIIPWGDHIVVIKGTGTCTCLGCHHVSHVEMKIRDDKSVYQNGDWITSKTGSRRQYRKILSDIVKSIVDHFAPLLIFALVWAMIIACSHFTSQKPDEKTLRMVSYQGQIYCVTGMVEDSFFRAEPLGGGREVLIPVKESKKVKVADFGTEKINQTV